MHYPLRKRQGQHGVNSKPGKLTHNFEKKVSWKRKEKFEDLASMRKCIELLSIHGT